MRVQGAAVKAGMLAARGEGRGAPDDALHPIPRVAQCTLRVQGAAVKAGLLAARGEALLIMPYTL